MPSRSRARLISTKAHGARRPLFRFRVSSKACSARPSAIQRLIGLTDNPARIGPTQPQERAVCDCCGRVRRRGE